MFFTLDRMEEGAAVLVGPDGTLTRVPAAALPKGTKDGDVLYRREDGSFEPAPDRTAARRSRMAGALRLLLGQEDEPGQG